jgi:hypothetical protein
MKTVLFAWEQGGGFGHIANLERFAALLKHHDIRPGFCAETSGSGRAFAGYPRADFSGSAVAGDCSCRKPILSLDSDDA